MNSITLQICQAIFDGKLDEVPQALLSVENVTAKLTSGHTPLHSAARHCVLNKMPPTALTAANLTAADDDGVTPLHKAADWGCLDQVPQGLLTLKNLTLPNKHGDTALILAADRGFTYQLPKALYPGGCRAYVRGFIATAIADGKLFSVPAEFITEENLIAGDKATGETPLHVAAHFGVLGELPAAILTAKNLTIRDKNGNTVLHLAVASEVGGLHDIPLEVLTFENLILENGAQEMVMDLAIGYGDVAFLSSAHLQSMDAHLQTLGRAKEQYHRSLPPSRYRMNGR